MNELRSGFPLRPSTLGFNVGLAQLSALLIIYFSRFFEKKIKFNLLTKLHSVQNIPEIVYNERVAVRRYSPARCVASRTRHATPATTPPHLRHRLF